MDNTRISLLDSQNRYALKRFGLKFAILLAFALVQMAPIGRTLTIMFSFASLFDLVLALVQSHHLWNRHFTYWDEAAAFLLLATIANRFL